MVPADAIPSFEDYITVPLDSAPVEIPLPYPILVKIGDNFITLRTKEDSLTSDRLKKLAEKGVQCLYIERQHWLDYVSHLETGLERIGISEGSEESAVGIRNVLMGYLRTIEERRQIEQSFFSKLLDLTGKLPIAIAGDLALANRMIRRYGDTTMYFSNHAINISIYSITIGVKLNLEMKQLQELAFSACVVNLGNIQIPKEILYKPKPLHGPQWDVIKKHPELGSNTLKLLLAPGYAWATALEHHERFDGRGYPRSLAGTDISLYARIATIAEVFSAMTSLRPWASPVPPEEAVSRMVQLTGKFDPSIFKMIAP